jgi:hypothetical protein
MNLAAIDISDHHAPTVSILIGNCVPNRGFVQQFCVSAAVSLFAQSHLPRDLGAGPARPIDGPLLVYALWA